MEVVTQTTTTKTTVIVLYTLNSIKKSTTLKQHTIGLDKNIIVTTNKNIYTTRKARQLNSMRGRQSEDNMKEATSAVRKMFPGLNKAAAHFSVSKATLQRHVHGSNLRAQEGYKMIRRSCDPPSDIQQDLYSQSHPSVRIWILRFTEHTC
jgi:helix-turn-helix, Psq domain